MSNRNNLLSSEGRMSQTKFSSDSYDLVLENEGELFNIEYVDKRLCEYTENLLYLVNGKILIEFLTLNLYGYIKSIKRRLLIKKIKKQLDLGMGFSDIREQFEMIDNTITNYALSGLFLKNLLLDTQNLLGSECEKLIRNCLMISEKRFYKIFSQPELIKFRLRIGSDFIQQISEKENKIISSSSSHSSNLNSSKYSNDNENDLKSKFRFFGNLLLFRIFFPSLVYEADLKNKQKYEFLNKLQTDGTLFNKLTKSFVGLLGSFLITYLFYIYSKHIVETDAYKAAGFVIVLFLILSIGLVFDHPKFRCIILLIIPFMASSRGRAIILMNCYTLTSIYVIPNFLNNFEIMFESFSCNKKLLKEKTQYLIDNNEMYDDFKTKIDEMKEIQRNVESSMQIMKKVVRKNLLYVNNSYQRLKEIDLINFKIFESFPTNFSLFIEQFVNNCYSYNINQYWYKWLFGVSGYIATQIACPFIYLISDSKLESLKNSFRQTKSYYKGVFREFKQNNIDKLHYEVDKRIDSFTDEFKFDIIEESNYTVQKEKISLIEKSLSIVQIYQERCEILNFYLYKINSIFPISIILLILGAISFHKNYLKKDDFQNYIIGIKFYEIDYNRSRKNLPTLLPLNDLLKIKYTEIFDLSLTKKERHFTIRSLITLSLLLLPIVFFSLAEHILISINYYLASNTHVSINYLESQDMNYKSEQNQRFLGNFYDLIFRLFKDSNNPEFDFDNKKCLPNVSPKNKENTLIIKSIILLYFLTVFQAYIKRLRSIFCGSVYPEREKERAIWLYNNLFSLYSKMGLIQRDKKKQSKIKLIFKKFLWKLLDLIYTIMMFISFYYCFGMIERVSLKSLIQKYKLKYLPIYLKYFPAKSQFCLICTIDSNKNDFVNCDNKNCAGLYCIDCFIGLKNLCKLCKRIICSEAQIDDELIEQDSSDDDYDDINSDLSYEKNYFDSKKERLKITGNVKFEIYDFDKDRAIEIIDDCFKNFYFKIENLMKSKLLFSVIKKSPNLAKLFVKNYDIFENLALFVIKNHIVNIKIHNCFGKNEISDINFFLHTFNQA